MDSKLIKDPVHGYIKIRKEYLKNIIDSCEFQRLRNIRQTSYDSLYPGSSHNRFIHSLGVYYLGVKAFKSLKRNIEEEISNWNVPTNITNWDDLKNTFELACLLHDVGHTPFSHTGEGFLLLQKENDDFEIMKKIPRKKNSEIYTLYNDLLRTLEGVLPEEIFSDFLYNFAETVEGSVHYDSKSKGAPKPHEIMSVIIGVEAYKEYLENQNVDYDLFARAILGICYKENTTLDKGVKNALIQLLNSSIIDVDRLDYIMRDMQMSGFDNMTIDIERLLESVTLIRDSQNMKYQFGYKKNAISTIENVVIAHDGERRWIQSHPIILYDSFLVKKCFEAVEKHFKEKDTLKCIFQKAALSEEGIILNNGNRLRLMNDGDFIYLMKQLQEDDPDNYYITEYLSRGKRRSPIWKSESEYNLMLKEFSDEEKKILLNIFTNYGGKEGESSIGSNLDADRMKELEQEIDKTSKDKSFTEEERQNINLAIKRKLFWLEKIQTYCTNNRMEFNIHNQRTDVFESKINQLTTKGIEIWYPQLKKSDNIAETLTLYNTSEKSGSNQFFYLYIKKSEKFSLNGFVKFLETTLKEYRNI